MKQTTTTGGGQSKKSNPRVSGNTIGARVTNYSNQFIPEKVGNRRNSTSLEALNHLSENQKLKKLEKIKELTLQEIEEKGYLDSWGDPITIQPEWPLKDTTGNHFRITSFNMNGISSKNKYLEWEHTIHSLHALQSDYTCITEANLDFHSPKVRDDVIQVATTFDKQSSLSLSASSEPPLTRNSTFKPGGTISMINGAWSFRLLNKGTDKFGRWTYMTLQGKSNRKITIVNIYRVCEQKGSVGNNTAYLQQQRTLERHYKTTKDPRKEILLDLEKFIHRLHAENHRIVLTGDANDDMSNPSSSFNKFLQRVNMYNAYTSKHPNTPLPITYDRGSRCIDFIALSDSLPPTVIKSTGFLPFYHPFATDHRGGYITTRHIHRRFTTSNTKRCDKYLHHLEEYYEKARLFKKTDDLQVKFNEYLKDPKSHDIHLLIEQCKKLETIRTEYMHAAEKRCGPQPYENGFSHSPKVLEAVEDLFEIKKEIRQIRVGLGQALPANATLEKAYELHSMALKALKKAQKDADIDREENLVALAEKRAKEWRMQEHNALKIIKHAEKSRRAFAKITRLIKGQQKGTLREVLTPDDDEPDGWKGMFDEVVGNYGENEENIQSILDGTFDVSDLGKEYPEFGNLVPDFVQAMASPKMTEKGINEATAAFHWKFGEEEYCKLFKKTRESTSCGPSGLHMSHWKAATERPAIARMYAFFMWAAFKFGFVYDRWTISWHCMIQKKDRPYINKLRIVQLFEGDFNGGLKYLLGRKLMYHIIDTHQMDDETFGSIPGRSAQEAMSLLQLLYDVHRLTKLPLAVLFNDADGCYDRIKAIMAEIAARRVGCPKEMVRVHTLAQLCMKHFIRTAAGISQGYVQWKKVQEKLFTFDEAGFILLILANIGGIGQGGGSGPVLWLVVMFIMIQVFRKYSKGATMVDPCGIINTLVLFIVSYVDDNTLLRSFQATTTMTEIMDTLRKELTVWQQLLQITGGDLSLSKCTVSIMKWKWVGWYATPELITIKDHPEDLEITSVLEKEGEPQKIQRIEPWEGERQLGIRLPLTGTFDTELLYRQDQVKQLASKLYAAPITHFEAYTPVYRSYYLPAIQYPLPITTFNDNECDSIQKPFIFNLLPKLGLNRHTSRTIIFAPMTHGGSGAILDLRVEQRYQQLNSFQQYLRHEGRVGKSLRIAINTYQVIIGSLTPFFQLDPAAYNYGDPTQRVHYIWVTARLSNVNITIPNMWTPQRRFQDDQALMDIAANSHFANNEQDMKAINACRIYLQVFTISDLCSYDGLRIYGYMIEGPRRHNHPKIQFPYQPMPTKQMWQRWKSFLACYVSNKGFIWYYPKTPLATPIYIAPSNSLLTTLLQHPPTESLSGYINSLPSALRTFTGTQEIPHDNGETIFNAIRNKEAQGACDGSHLPMTMTGAHAYILSSTALESTLPIKGYGRTPALRGMSSQQPEHFGLIGLLITILGLCRINKYEDHTVGIEIWIDNKEVLRRALCKKAPRKFSSYAHPDFDLWEFTRKLLQQMPVKIILDKVKAHQDEIPTEDRDIATELNIEADKLASTCMKQESSKQPPPTPLLDEGGVYYMTKDNINIGDLRSYIHEQMHLPNLLEYYQHRRGWTKAILTTINWRALEGSLRALHPHQRLKAMQYIHNWQNTGHQKLKFAENNKKINATQTTQSDSDDDSKESIDKCPMKCGERETNLHYLHCHSSKATTMRKTASENLHKTLRRLDTHEGILSIISMILQGGHNQEWTKDYLLTTPISKQDKILLEAVKEQHKIGWDAFFQGFLSKQWETAQRTHLELNKRKRDYGPYGWGGKLTCALYQYGRDMWQVRNKSIHGDGDELSRLERREKAQTRVRQLYNDRRRQYLPREDRKTFNLPLEQRLKHGTMLLTSWANLTEDRLQRNSERVEKERETSEVRKWMGREPPPQLEEDTG